MELDHFFVLTEPGAPAADRLSAIGLTEGSRNHHPGQGTANRRFFFPDAALELLYLRDSQEASRGRASRLRFAERADTAGASPFGLIVRSTGNNGDLPFPGWRYCPEYFAAGQCFHVGENADLLEEPLCICLPPGMPLPDAREREANRHFEVSDIRVDVPVARPSRTLQAIADCERVSLRFGRPHLLQLVLNSATSGRTADMRPELPLIVHW